MRSIDLRDIPLFQSLGVSEKVLVEICLRQRTFKKGEMLLLEGNTCERIFIVKSGRVKLFRTASNGREQILEILNPGDTCACNPGALSWSCATNAQALADGTVWFLSRDDYVKLVKTNANLTHALNKLFADRLCRFSSLIVDVSLNEVHKRLIKFILDMSEHQDHAVKQDEVLSLDFTREEIAQRIGAARETVVRQLYQLKEARLIEIKPKQIIIRNKDGLQRRLNE